MAGGVPPKPPGMAQRRNKPPSHAKLPTAAEVTTSPAALPVAEDNGVVIPPLPMTRVWYDETIEEWNDIWRSEMASQWVRVDYHGLLKLAMLINDFWDPEASTNGRKDLLVEIRLQRAAWGLTPLDRNRLHWETDRGQQASTRTRQREAKANPVPQTGPKLEDPRAALGRQGLQLVPAVAS